MAEQKFKSKDIIADTIQLSGGTGDSGTISWNPTEGTLDINQDGQVLKIGQETHYYCHNDSGSQIDAGTPVMATGTHVGSGSITIAPMDGTVQTNARYFLGITTQDIPDSTEGKVIHFGKISGIDTSSWTAGDILWIDTSIVGSLTNILPTSGLALQTAYVISQDMVTGSILVNSNSIDGNSYVTLDSTSQTKTGDLTIDGGYFNINTHTAYNTEVFAINPFGAIGPNNNKIYIKNTIADGWEIGLWDTIDNSGTLNIDAENFTYNANNILSTANSIKDLNDVFSSMGPNDGEVLTYDSINGWQSEPSAGGGLADASSNGTTYARRDASWVEVVDLLGGQIITDNLIISATTSAQLELRSSNGVGGTGAELAFTSTSDSQNIKIKHETGDGFLTGPGKGLIVDDGPGTNTDNIHFWVKGQLWSDRTHNGLPAEVIDTDGGQTINGNLTLTSNLFLPVSGKISGQNDTSRILFSGSNTANTINGAYIIAEANDYGGASLGGDLHLYSGNDGSVFIDGVNMSGVETNANNYSHPNHTGDVTSSGDGITTIVANAITEGKILDNNVTFPKLTNISQNQILGRNSAGTGNIEALNSTQIRSILNVADGANAYVHPSYNSDDIDVDTTALTGATVISDLNFNITTDAQGHVTDANGEVFTRTLTLANLGYTGELNATADQTAAEIRVAVEAATDSNIFTDNDHTKLNNIDNNANNYSHPNHTGDVTSSGDGATVIVSNAITSAKIADDNVTYAKIQNMNTDRLLGRITASSGIIEELTPIQVRTLLNVADSANAYVHPSHPGDDIDIDTTALTGATVISDLNFNITTDSSGHVTDANGIFSTRNLTLSNLGYTGDTNAEANPDLVSQAEAEAGTAITERIWSAQRVSQAIAALSSGSTSLGKHVTDPDVPLFSATPFTLSSSQSSNLWASMGPTGAGTTETWSVLDSVPLDADWVEISFTAQFNGGTASTNASLSIWARAYGSSTSNQGSTLIASARARADSSGNAYTGDQATRKIQLDSSNRFETYWSWTNANNRTVIMYLIGYGYNDA